MPLLTLLCLADGKHRSLHHRVLCRRLLRQTVTRWHGHPQDDDAKLRGVRRRRAGVVWRGVCSRSGDYLAYELLRADQHYQ